MAHLISDDDKPLLLTLLMDEDSQNYFQGLRDQYYPPARNIVPAHVSLFHNLPGSERQHIEADLEEFCHIRSFTLPVTGLKFMGGGVMYKIESPELDGLRKQLATQWGEWLIPQDKQKFEAHVVVQNKVNAEEARETFQVLKSAFEPFEARAFGLHLWTYLNGPWRSERLFLFG